MQFSIYSLLMTTRQMAQLLEHFFSKGICTANFGYCHSTSSVVCLSYVTRVYCDKTTEAMKHAVFSEKYHHDSPFSKERLKSKFEGIPLSLTGAFQRPEDKVLTLSLKSPMAISKSSTNHLWIEVKYASSGLCRS